MLLPFSPLAEPTPVHEVADVHETAVLLSPAGDEKVQDDPSHTSAVDMSPTATHAVVVGQETPRRAPGPGDDTTLHDDPFHSSVRELKSALPTAIQFVLEAHETASSSVLLVPGLGLLTNVHADPFQTSVMGTIFNDVVR